MSKLVELKPLKIRAWKLAAGDFLVLVFIRTKEDQFQLLAEHYADDEAGIADIANDAKRRLEAVLVDVGIEGGEAFIEFAGAKKP